MTRGTGPAPPGKLPPLGSRSGATRPPVLDTTDAVPRPSPAPGTGAETGESELRGVIDDAWEGLAVRIDRLLGSGCLLDRRLVVDLARFLDHAGPAVDAYEQLLSRVAAADATAGER